MKKFKLMTLAILIGTSSLFAMTSNPDLVKKEIRTEIINLLKTPDFQVDKEINILMTFTFSSEGKIIVLDVNTKNNDVLNYIRKNINHKKINNASITGKKYIMPLKLKAS
ncbi:hypothetical protein [Lutibacter citreus]|uniref:hypothetical protein n=1 Tax=Lutibacter citreus TaxID=2138210 RepID=UPI001300AFC2|nr:hypothetical protein [Lutibacter citreus]